MNASNLGKLALLALLALTGLGARAEDIDLYSGSTANGASPNVIILVDSRGLDDANFTFTCPYPIIGGSTQGKTLFDMIQCSLYGSLEAIKTQPALLGKLNIGLMSYGTGSNKGGLWWSPAPFPASLPAMDAQGILNAQALVSNGITKANNGAAASVFQEAWAFFTGNTGLSTHSYSDHIAQACQKSFIIYIGAATKNGNPSSGDSGLSDLQAAAATIGATVSSTPIDSSNLGPYTKFDSSSWMDEWAKFLYSNDFDNGLGDKQNIVTYTIAAQPDGAGDSLNFTQTLTSTANNGGGKPFVAANLDDMTKALLTIFNEVQAVNSVFAAPGLPVSANAQGTYLNQIFIATFRPDASANPRWMGNLKQYQFGVDTTVPGSPSLFLGDASWGPYQPNKTANSALSSAGTGFISPNAISFWTAKDISKLPDSISPTTDPRGGFWINFPQGKGGGFDLPDGEFAEKGGVSQQIRLASLTNDYAVNTSGPRNLYTCAGTSCTGGASLSGMPLAETNSDVDATLLGITGPSSTVSTLSRNGTTVTATLSAAPSPALTDGQTVTIAGSAYPQLNGSFTITLVNSTTFKYTITEGPPSPSSGSYTASIPSSPKAITTLTRAGTVATATISSGHGYSNGQSITIAGANEAEYNGTFVIAVVNSTQFTYTISDSPGTPTVGGSAVVGATPTITFAASQITRNATASDGSSIVTVTASSALNSVYKTGATVTVSGVTPSGYNATATILFGGGNSQGNSCPNVTNSNKTKAFCYKITTTPAITATGSPTADVTAAVAISSLTHAAACTAGSPNITVTATTATTHPFVTGETVSIGGTIGAGEAAYVTSASVAVLSSTQFTYTITTSPPCSPSATGVTAITNSGGIDRTTLIRWIRGQDNLGDEPSPANGITVRGSIHGDVLHSRPAIINYGGTTGIVAFYGANDGVFRAINGNQPPATNTSTLPLGYCKTTVDCSIGGVPPGGELWGFVASEFLPKMQRLYRNTPSVKLAGTPTGIVPTPLPKDYFFDGPSSIYQDSANNKAYVYLSARRGGRLIYALDVSNPTAPKFLWKHTNADTGFGELGQTWSQPKVAFIGGHTNPVLIFGAGYDTNEDLEPPGVDTMGRGIFIVDAVDGTLLWRAGPGTTSNTCTGTPCLVQDMTYAIASDITLVDRNFDGKIDRLYAADTGGNIWRVDLEPTSSTDDQTKWQLTKFAALGGTGTTKRKFFFPPDVVPTKTFDAVLAGTGDREHPLLQQTDALGIVNRFYMIKDTKTGMNAASTPAWVTVVDNSSSTTAAAPSPATLFDATTTLYDGSLSGFYLTLNQNAQKLPSVTDTRGEKVVNAPTTVGGFTFFGTNQPKPADPNSCEPNLGNARGYKVNFLTGASAFTLFDGGGMPPSPVFGIVNVMVDGKETQLPFLIGGGGGGDSSCVGPDCKSGLGGQKPPLPINPKKKKTYWYREVDR